MLWLAQLSRVLSLARAETQEEANCTVEDVKDEIFDMVKPADRAKITLQDLEACKVGDTVVGMLTDMHAFWQYDRREQLMDHGQGQAEPPE